MAKFSQEFPYAFPGISWSPPQNVLLWRAPEISSECCLFLPDPFRATTPWDVWVPKCLTKPLWFSTLSAPALGQLASITSVDLLSCVTYNPSSLSHHSHSDLPTWGHDERASDSEVSPIPVGSTQALTKMNRTLIPSCCLFMIRLRYCLHAIQSLFFHF